VLVAYKLGIVKGQLFDVVPERIGMGVTHPSLRPGQDDAATDGFNEKTVSSICGFSSILSSSVPGMGTMGRRTGGGGTGFQDGWDCQPSLVHPRCQLPHGLYRMVALSRKIANCTESTMCNGCLPNPTPMNSFSASSAGAPGMPHSDLSSASPPRTTLSPIKCFSPEAKQYSIRRLMPKIPLHHATSRSSVRLVVRISVA